jgi:PIN domain nuclease of toxin-antitoxin system
MKATASCQQAKQLGDIASSILQQQQQQCLLGAQRMWEVQLMLAQAQLLMQAWMQMG